jgi:hypothetical protein
VPKFVHSGQEVIADSLITHPEAGVNLAVETHRPVGAAATVALVEIVRGRMVNLIDCR